jgi:uncharacterized membrane protein affecting hemolysin expression
MATKGLRRRRRVFGGGAGAATGLRASLGLLGATRGDWFTVKQLVVTIGSRRATVQKRRILIDALEPDRGTCESKFTSSTRGAV